MSTRDIVLADVDVIVQSSIAINELVVEVRRQPWHRPLGSRTVGLMLVTQLPKHGFYF